MVVLGRHAELHQIDAWLQARDPAAPDRAAPPGALVIEGEAGIGKTTLWSAAVDGARASGWQVLSCRPAPSDAGLPLVGLADLLQPVPETAYLQLATPQRRALLVALLREDAGSDDLDARAVGTGLTALLGALAQGRPLLIAVDDAQWLDLASARAVAFAIRRLDSSPLRMAAAIRTDASAGRAGGALAALESSFDSQALIRIPVGPLTMAAMHQLFQHALGRSFPRPVLARIHRAAGGNPFYALEIGREVIRLGVPPPGRPLPVPEDHRELALLRLRRLPRATRDALAVVAASSRAAAVDPDLEALGPAERAGIVRVQPDGRVEFTHPLYGSAMYSALTEAERRSLHRGLADRAAGPEERARHLALAADGPDRATADALDRAAAAAGARGAADAAVELMDLACRLTPRDDQQNLVRRERERAERRYFAGDPTGARHELEQLHRSRPAGPDRASVLLELGSVVWVQGEGDLAIAYLTQALAEAGTDALRARIHSRIAALSDDADVAVEHGEAALALMDEHEDPVLYCFALHNVALFRLYAGHGADHAAIEKGMQLQRDVAAWEMSTVPAFWARNFDDFDTARARFLDLLRAFREQGDEATVTGVLTHLSRIEAMTGRMERARELADEAVDLAEQTEQETYLQIALCAKGYVCAQAGDLEVARHTCDELLSRLDVHPDVILEGMARAVLGLVALSAGNLAEADAQLSRAHEIEDLVHNREPATNRFHADHAEAVIGLGDLARAETLVQRLEARATALPRPWILAVAARCRGLLNAARGDLDLAMADYLRAVEVHQSLDMPIEYGRTLLAAGRLHRRRNERQAAQKCLSEAVVLFDSAGAAAWAAIARDELGRTHGRRGSSGQLTASEQQVADLAAAGLRNTEIAARLFLSGKTVEANLSRAYRKLGVRSRTELASHVAVQAAAQQESGSEP